MSEKVIRLDKEKQEVLETIDHVLKVGHGEVVIKITDHTIVNIKHEAQFELAKQNK